MVGVWRNFKKNSCDRASDGRMAHVLGVKASFGPAEQFRGYEFLVLFITALSSVLVKDQLKKILPQKIKRG
jgi:hypothetical protein